MLFDGARACAWVDSQLEHFRVDRAPVHLMATIKAVAELGHAAEVLGRSARPGAAETGRRWMDLAWERLDGGETIRQLVAADPQFVPVAITYLPFALAGRVNERLRATVAAQLPRTVMDPLGWTMTVPALAILGVPATPIMEERARPMSVLANRTRPELLPQDAVYLFAHECLYETRWGQRPPGWGATAAEYVLAALPALLERWRAAGDPDVLAELVAALHAVRPGCVPQAAWDLIGRAQQPAGNMAPNRLVTIFPRLPHPVLTRTYHTTLVAIMAWAGCPHPADGPRSTS
jgi:hypothetical protein